MTAPSSARFPLGSSPRNQWRVSAETVDLTRPGAAAAANRRGCRAAAPGARSGPDGDGGHRHAERLLLAGGLAGHIGVDVTPARAADRAAAATCCPALRADRRAGDLGELGQPARPAEPAAPRCTTSTSRRARAWGWATRCRSTARGCWSAVAGRPPMVDELAAGRGRRAGRQVPHERLLGHRARQHLAEPGRSRRCCSAGVNADQCVLATLMDANFLGYDCVLRAATARPPRRRNTACRRRCTT